MSIRMQKVNMEIKKQITHIINHEVDDPGLSFISITRVMTTADLTESRVYFSVLDERDASHAADSLNSMAGFIRKMLGRQLRLKLTPKIIFAHDDCIRYSVEIYDKIEKIKNDKQDS